MFASDWIAGRETNRTPTGVDPFAQPFYNASLCKQSSARQIAIL